MSKLAAALAWARRGFPVFPLVPNGKEPAFGESWYDTSTTDETAIRAMWTDPVLHTERDYNIGVDCTDRIVIDVDMKDGKDGVTDYVNATSGGEWNTLVVRTPTGGFHVYFEGPDSGNASISKAVDVRSHHGYVVAPGSTIDGRAYEVYRDLEPTWVPFTVERLLAPVEQRREFAATDGDTAANIQAAVNYLQSAPPAIEGQRGDETTFIVAARLVREMGLSEYMALQLLVEHYNPRCVPPWSLDELSKKVENASQYGTADLGRLDPATLLGGVVLPPPPSVLAGSDWGNALDPYETPDRPWLIERLLMSANVTGIVATGGVGKSTLNLIIAAHIALGRDLGPYKTLVRGRVVVYNGEDDKEEQSRRLQAICQLYGFDYSKVRSEVLLLDDTDLDMRQLVVRNGYNGSVENTALSNGLIEKMKDPRVVLFIGDPLVDMHSGEETDPVHMNTVIRAIKRIAKQATVGVILSLHATKGGDRQEERIGNMDIARGSSAVANKMRSVFTMLNASDKDCEDYGLQDHERGLWLRLDDAKMNMALKGDKTLWFKRQGVVIQSGDVVGVLSLQELKKNSTALKLRIAGHLIDNMMANSSATMMITQAAAYLKAVEPLWGNKTDTEIRQRLEGMFSVAVDVMGRRIQIVRDSSGKPTVVLS